MYNIQLCSYFDLNFCFQIDIDFARKYPDSVNSIYQKFDDVMDHILLHHLPKSGGTGLKYLLDKLNEESISGTNNL